MILLFIIFIQSLRYVFIRSILVFIIFSLLVALTNSGKEDIAHRMFVKTYKQLVDKNADTNKVSNNVMEIENLELIEKIKKINIFSPNHQGHYILAAKLFRENIIFGAGQKGFRHYCRTVEYDPPEGITSTHPHNILAQFLSELGLIGFLFYITSVIFILRIFYRNYKSKYNDFEVNGLLVILIALMIYLFPLIPSGNFFNNWISSFLYFNIGLFLFSYKSCS